MNETEGSGRMKQILLIALCLFVFAFGIFYNHTQDKKIQPMRLTEMLGFTDAGEKECVK